MMKLNLQQFAKSASYIQQYRASKKVAKESMPGKPAKNDNSFQQGRVEKEISSKKTYILFEVTDANDRNERNPKRAAGSTLRNMIADEKITYNRRKRVWVGKSKKNYVIRELKGGR